MSEGTDKVVRASVERALSTKGGGLRGLNQSLWVARHEAGYLDDIALTRADYRELARVSEPERSRRLFRRALADLGESRRPVEFVSQLGPKPSRVRTTAGGLAGQLLMHEVHHRAQVMAMLRQIGVAAENLDYSALVWERTPLG